MENPGHFSVEINKNSLLTIWSSTKSCNKPRDAPRKPPHLQRMEDHAGVPTGETMPGRLEEEQIAAPSIKAKV